MRNKILSNLIGFLIAFLPIASNSDVITAPKQHDDLVGQVQVTTVKLFDSFEKIARRYNVGYYEMVEANPTIDPDHLHHGESITIPSYFILPMSFRDGIVVNIAEMRLYYFMKDTGKILTEPVGIGRQGWVTPISSSVIAEKEANPIWNVPKSIQLDSAAKGIKIPDRVFPGIDNPLGDHLLRLSYWGYLIHGTNEPGGVGRRSSAGCVRMYPEGVKKLFDTVAIGTPVHIINEPFKLGMRQKELFLEVHQPLQEDTFDPTADISPVVDKIKEMAAKTPLYVNWAAVEEVTQQQKGIPIRIGELA